MTDPHEDRANSAEPLDAVGAALRALGMVGPSTPNRAARRRHRGEGAGQGKHPLGATKPLRAEAATARRRRRGSR